MLGGWSGVEWQAKVKIQNGGRTQVKPHWKICSGSLMAEMKQNQHCK